MNVSTSCLRVIKHHEVSSFKHYLKKQSYYKVANYMKIRCKRYEKKCFQSESDRSHDRSILYFVKLQLQRIINIKQFNSENI